MKFIHRTDQKTYLEGVRRITWDNGEMCEFASAFVAAMECVDEPISYHEATFACGAAFRFSRSPERWNYGHYSALNIEADPYEPIRRAFRWAGRDCIFRERGEMKDDAAFILASIDRGIPVIASQVVGPSDFSILAGYDEGGSILMGWSAYQYIKDDHDFPHDSTGYFRKPDWHPNAPLFVFVGEAIERAPRRERYLDALRYATKLARGENAKAGWLGGSNAYEALARDVETDEYFPENDKETLSMRYLSLLCDHMMLDDRRSTPPMLRRMAEEEPDWEKEATEAALNYEKTIALRDSIREILPEDFSEAAIRSLSDRSMRSAYADAIRQIRESDERAILRIEALLERRS